MRKAQRILLIILVLTFLGLFFARTAYKKETTAEQSYVSLGKELAMSSGCFACHGTSAGQEMVDFRQGSNGKWRNKSIPTIFEDGIDDPAILTEWIRDGVTEKQKKKHAQFLIQMPAYGNGYLSEEEIESIVSWILVENIRMNQGAENAEKEIPELVDHKFPENQLIVLGDRLSRKYACYQCHGELGQGGVQNPKSFKGYIPGFYGHEFLELTANGDREDIKNWVAEGHGIDIESGIKGKLAKGYFEAQAIDMPAYKDLMSNGELNTLIDYMLLLNKRGSMNSTDLKEFSTILVETKFNLEQSDN